LGYTSLAVESWGDLKGWLVDHGLSMWDKAGMRWSTEIRVPLVDPDFVDFMLNVPATMRGARPGTKLMLRQLFQGELPDEVIRLPKHGFQAPAASWIRGPLKETFRGLIYELPTAVFRHDYLDAMWSAFNKRSGDYALKLWCLACLSGWSKAQQAGW
jgi:asparagine synthase (glutamine-hydrolysing)